MLFMLFMVHFTKYCISITKVHHHHYQADFTVMLVTLFNANFFGGDNAQILIKLFRSWVVGLSCYYRWPYFHYCTSYRIFIELSHFYWTTYVYMPNGFYYHFYWTQISLLYCHVQLPLWFMFYFSAIIITTFNSLWCTTYRIFFELYCFC